MDLKKIEQLGAMDYYLDLKNYINKFVNNNFPLTQEDMRILANGENSYNTSKRKEIYTVMENELEHILENIMDKNTQFLKDLNEDKNVKSENIEQYKKNLFMYKQQLLEAVWKYKKSSNSIQSRTVFDNEKYLTDAINSGISGEAISSTLEGIVEKVGQTGQTPTQLKEAVEVVAEMKSGEKEADSNSEEYSSTLVRENSGKIKSALNNGLTSSEVAVNLTNSLKSSNNRKEKKHLRFVVKFIARTKRKERTLSNNMQKGVQKIKI